jgi:hypothetical protein
MLSSYRLGDLVMLSLNESEKNTILTEHPNSFASKYILESKKQNNEYRNIELITKIVVEYIEQNTHILPKDIEDSIVIHLRLGDVVAGNTDHEKEKRPLDKNIIKELLINDTKKKYIIGNCFFAKPSSNNYEECINKSNEYLESIISELDATHFDSKNADVDLCLAVKAKLFVQGKGYYSKLIVEIRKKLNLPNIEL